MYCKAAKSLQTASALVQSEKNPVTMNRMRAKCAEYRSRMEMLKRAVEAERTLTEQAKRRRLEAEHAASDASSAASNAAQVQRAQSARGPAHAMRAP